eukprot:1911823-Alexandrium_andersonii.AAC.1
MFRPGKGKGGKAGSPGTPGGPASAGGARGSEKGAFQGRCWKCNEVGQCRVDLDSARSGAEP